MKLIPDSNERLTHARLESLVARKDIVNNAVAFLSEVAQKEWMARLPMKQATLSSLPAELVKAKPAVPADVVVSRSIYQEEPLPQTGNIADINQARLIANREAISLSEEEEDFDYPGYTEQKSNVVNLPTTKIGIDEALRDLGYREAA